MIIYVGCNHIDTECSKKSGKPCHMWVATFIKNRKNGESPEYHGLESRTVFIDDSEPALVKQLCDLEAGDIVNLEYSRTIDGSFLSSIDKIEHKYDFKEVNNNA